MNTLEKYYINKEAMRDNHLNDQHTVTHNKIFEVIYNIIIIPKTHPLPTPNPLPPPNPFPRPHPSTAIPLPLHQSIIDLLSTVAYTPKFSYIKPLDTA
jgi:hypothetical protein